MSQCLFKRWISTAVLFCLGMAMIGCALGHRQSVIPTTMEPSPESTNPSTWSAPRLQDPQTAGVTRTAAQAAPSMTSLTTPAPTETDAVEQIIHTTPKPTSTPTPTSIPVPPNGMVRELIQITNARIEAFEWAADGKTVYYKLWKKEGVREWWSLEMETGETHPVESPHPESDVSPLLLARLEPPEGRLLGVTLSPDGSRVLYVRTPDEYKKPLTPVPFEVFPFELWTANSDGNQATKLGQVPVCFYLGFVGWFDNGQQALISCDYEGPGSWWVVDLKRNKLETFEARTGCTETIIGSGDLLSSGWFAFGDYYEHIWIVSLSKNEGCQMLQTGQKMGNPIWSKDGQWLYFLGDTNQKKVWPQVSSIQRYNVGTGEQQVLADDQIMGQLPWVVVDTEWRLSPDGSKALFDQPYGLWLVSWTNP